MASKKAEKPRHLGRGLQSLLSPITANPPQGGAPAPGQASGSKFPPDRELRESLERISVENVSPNPYQARTVWGEEELAELAESIRANGIIQPIVVRRAGSGYQLIAGERRFRAAQLGKGR